MRREKIQDSARARRRSVRTKVTLRAKRPESGSYAALGDTIDAGSSQATGLVWVLGYCGDEYLELQ